MACSTASTDYTKLFLKPIRLALKRSMGLVRNKENTLQLIDFNHRVFCEIKYDYYNR